MMRYVFGVIGVIVLAVAAIVLISSRGPSRPDVENAEKQVNLTDFVSSPVDAVFTHEGEIKGEDEHDTIRITINRTQRKVEHFRGYDGQVLTSQTFSNTQEAFDHFMHALKIAGFSAIQEAKYESHKGVCPFGSRYIYELLDGSQRIMRLWSASCGDEDGNFAGEDRQVRKLFENQIPNYNDFTRGLAL